MYDFLEELMTFLWAVFVAVILYFCYPFILAVIGGMLSLVDQRSDPAMSKTAIEHRRIVNRSFEWLPNYPYDSQTIWLNSKSGEVYSCFTFKTVSEKDIPILPDFYFKLRFVHYNPYSAEGWGSDEFTFSFLKDSIRDKVFCFSMPKKQNGTLKMFVE